MKLIRRCSKVSNLKSIVPCSKSLNELKRLTKRAEVMIAGTYVHDEVISSAEDLKLIHSLGVGVDRYNLKLLKGRRITLTNFKGANSPSVAEHVFALILALAKKSNLYGFKP